MPDTIERLARIEADIQHVIRAVDRTENMMPGVGDRLTRVEERAKKLEESLPQVARNTVKAAYEEGWKEAVEDAQGDRKASVAIVISALALVFTGVTNIMIWIGRI